MDAGGGPPGSDGPARCAIGSGRCPRASIRQTVRVTAVARLLMAPLKSTRLVEVDRVELGPDGVEGDRAFFLLGADGSSLRGPRRLPLCRLEATWAEGVLSVRLPDGVVVAGEPVDGEPVRARWDMDLEVDAVVVEGPWAVALSAFCGEPVRLARVARGRGGWSGFPVSVIGGPSIDALGLGPVDPRRFRMLVETAGGAPFAEDAWVGRDVRIGAALVRIEEACARCAVTTVDPETGERDVDALRAMVTAKGVADLGVYGRVLEPGTVRVGDPVALV